MSLRSGKISFDCSGDYSPALLINDFKSTVLVLLKQLCAK